MKLTAETVQCAAVSDVMSTSSKSLTRYVRHLDLSNTWLRRSIKSDGGSAAYLGIWGSWSKAYPETTGYLVPTLLDYAKMRVCVQSSDCAFSLGEWLLGTQMDCGAFPGGTYPSRSAKPSVFNTAQILIGLCALYRQSREERWLHSAQRAVDWLLSSLTSEGLFTEGNYVNAFNPSYYTRVAWPMLEVWAITGDERLLDASHSVLERIKSLVHEKGVFDWAFKPGLPAFTHTIAYTIRGFVESSRILQDFSYLASVEHLVDIFYRKAELSGGALPGMFDSNLRGVGRFCCLTGSSQMAIVLLKCHLLSPDLRLVNGAAKLVDFVCSKQVSSRFPIVSFRGAIFGSSPFWERYLRLRCPNWAVKFHSDSLLLLCQILHEEGLVCHESF